MKFKIFIFLLSFLFVFSCKDDECVTPDSLEINDSFNPMTVGSYWIYHWYKVDTLGNEEQFSWIDTTRVIKDTLIDGIVFKKIEDRIRLLTSEKSYQYLRVSNGDLINQNGSIFFSLSNFTDTLNQTNSSAFFSVIYKMTIPDAPIFTSLGEFDCLNFQGKANPLIPTNWTERFLNNYYSKGVGKVLSNYFFFSNTEDFQRRLVEYHIE